MASESLHPAISPRLPLQLLDVSLASGPLHKLLFCLECSAVHLLSLNGLLSLLLTVATLLRSSLPRSPLTALVTNYNHRLICLLYLQPLKARTVCGDN